MKATYEELEETLKEIQRASISAKREGLNFEWLYRTCEDVLNPKSEFTSRGQIAVKVDDAMV